MHELLLGGVPLQILALIHFIRRRPQGFWIWVIFLGGGLGAAAYLLCEALPDMLQAGGSIQVFSHRKRVRQLEALVQQNPSVGNLEELGALYLERKDWTRARDAYMRAIEARADHPDPWYRRALAAMELGDFAGAAKDLEYVLERDAKYDRHRAPALMAHVAARLGRTEEAEKRFAEVAQRTISSETMCNYAQFLAEQGRHAEAREWAQKVLDKKPAMPAYLRRIERPWLRRAAALVRSQPAA